MTENTLQSITEKPITTQQVTPDIQMIQFPLVNAFLVGDPNSPNPQWVLIGAGMAHTAKAILQAAEARFGKGSKPAAIILTHGHFDHVGAIMELMDKWQVQVYAHQSELPYLTGQQDYPAPDPTVDQGLLTKISPTFPHKSIDLGASIKPLPADGGVPGMSGWRWVHTPGHSPGHVSLFRDSDRTLIVGDAFTTVKQGSAEAVLHMEKDVNGPPAYFTTDWQAAQESVKTLKDLDPELVLPSHGLPMQRAEFDNQLNDLVAHFAQEAVPRQGKYVNQSPPLH